MEGKRVMGCYTIREVAENVYGIGDKPEGWPYDFPNTDCYLIVGKNHALLLDAGMTKGPLLQVVRTITDLPVTLVILHGHIDHIGGMADFEDVCMSVKDIPVIKQLHDDAVFDFSNVRDLTDGMRFELGDRHIGLYAVPGHTPGSFVALDPDHQQLFTSDTLGSTCIWMHIPGTTTVAEMLPGLERVWKLVKDMDQLQVFVGHAYQAKEKLDKTYVEDVLHAAEGLVNGTLTGKPMEDYPGNQFHGGWVASYGNMHNFCYDPKRLR